MANITLDGVTTVDIPEGQLFWFSNSTSGASFDHGGDSSTIDLTGDWFMGWLGLFGGGDWTITDSSTGGVQMDAIRVDGGLDMDLTNASIFAMDLYGGDHDIVLGNGFTRSISSGADNLTLEVNGGELRSLNVWQGASDITVNGFLNSANLNGPAALAVNDGGSVLAASLWGDVNTVTLDNADIELLETGGDDDDLTLTGEGAIDSWVDRDGVNDLTLSDNANVKSFDLRDGTYTIAIGGDARMEQGEIDDSDVDVTLTGNGRLEYAKQYGGSFTATLSDSARIDNLIFGEGDGSITMAGNSRVNNMWLEEGTFDVTTADRFVNSAEFWNADFEITVGAGGAGAIEAGSEIARSQVITTEGYVDHIQIRDDQDVVLTMNGGGGAVRLDDIKDEVFINNGFVRTIETRGGRDDIVIDNGGGVGLFDTGDDGDRLKITDGRVDFFDAGGGNDRLNSRNNGELGVIVMGNGSDRAQIRAGFTELLSLGAGNDRAWVRHEAEVGLLRSERGDSIIQVRDDARVEAMQNFNGFLNLRAFDTTMVGSLDTNNGDTRIRFFDDARVNSMKLDQGTHDIVTNGGFIESVAMWQSSSVMEIGAGGAGQVRMWADEEQTHDITFVGFVDTLRLGGTQTTTLTWGEEGGHGFRLGEGNDTVTGGEGWVEVLSTRGGDDEVTLSGGAEVVRLGDGNDTITTGDDFIGMINTGNGDDVVQIGTGFVGLTRLGGGDDTLTVDPAYTEFGLTIWAGAGDDSVDGTVGGDQVYGGSGMDTITGGAGDDVISGGEDDDLLSGGADADIFLFAAQSGTDIVTDFEQGPDVLKIDEHAGGFASLVISVNGGDLEVTHDGGTIVLQGLAGATLTEADFVF